MNDIESFVNNCIEHFSSTIEFTKTSDTIDNDNKRDYTMRAIKESYDHAFGALLYMKCWARELTEDEFKKLADKLITAKFKAIDTALDTF
jgi:hypothetical protein